MASRHFEFESLRGGLHLGSESIHHLIGITLQKPNQVGDNGVVSLT